MRRNTVKSFSTKCLVPLVLAGAVSAANAAYPERSIRIIVPFTPGGATDVLARMIGNKFTQTWGQQAVIDNRTGGNGVIAYELTAKSNPDGHTVLFVAISHAINPLLNRKLPYDTDRDFTPVSLIASMPLLVAVHPSLPAKSVQELVALAKSRPKPLNYASGGVGSSQHLAAELLNYMAKIRMTHVPYKGGNQGLLDLVGGHVDLMISTILSVSPHAKAGRLRALAVTTSARNAAWPDLPTVSEAGLRGYESIAWYGMVVPSGVPSGVLDKLSAETIKAAQSSDMRETLVKQGADPVGSTPREFAAFIKSESTKYARVIREAGVKAE
jgi:tripartite-type tricarboxylate transporter receptor subunit TctC